MAKKIIMPKQGLQMTEGTITQWLVSEGGTVEKGLPLFEMETDKLTITMDAEVSGTLLKIVRPEGDTVPITELIAVVGEPGEDISSLLNGPESGEALKVPTPETAPAAVHTETPVAASAPTERIFISPRARMVAEEKGIDYSSIKGTSNDGSIIERDIVAYEQAQPKITPLAANIAKVQGIDLSGVTGTGANGKITTSDLSGATPAVPSSSEVPAHIGRGIRTERMNGMRRAISSNMLASKSTNAQTNHRMTMDMTAVIALRAAYKELGIKVSYNDIIVRACAQALMDFPILNASVDGDNIIYHDYANIGTAVSVPGGLIVPVIRDADLIGLRGIAARSSELIEKARNGKLTDSDYHGGTFTVSSLGMFDLDDFVAIINPPESAILAVGKIAKTPVVITNNEGEDEITVKSLCTMCLSYDHRIIDGAEAARFLQTLKRYLANPALLI